MIRNLRYVVLVMPELRDRHRVCGNITFRDLAEDLRGALTQRLAYAGFDEYYEPTEEGRLLESLIDRWS